MNWINVEVDRNFYKKFTAESKKNKKYFKKKNKYKDLFDLRGFVNKKFKDSGISQIENISVDTFAIKNEYFSHRRAKKLGEDDYGRCISVIKKISS